MQEEACLLGHEPDAGLRVQVEDRQVALGIQGSTPAQGAVQAGVEGKRPLLGGPPGGVHSHAHLLVGVLICILHHQGVAARLQRHYLELDIHITASASGQWWV